MPAGLTLILTQYLLVNARPEQTTSVSLRNNVCSTPDPVQGYRPTVPRIQWCKNASTAVNKVADKICFNICLSAWEFSHGSGPARHEAAATAQGHAARRCFSRPTQFWRSAQLRFFKAFIAGNEMSCSFYTRKWVRWEQKAPHQLVCAAGSCQVMEEWSWRTGFLWGLYTQPRTENVSCLRFASGREQTSLWIF
jgi:hypothetical protein